MKARVGTRGLIIEPETADEREGLEAFVKKAGPDVSLAVAEVTHKSDTPDGPTEVRIDWRAKE